MQVDGTTIPYSNTTNVKVKRDDYDINVPNAKAFKYNQC